MKICKCGCRRKQHASSKPRYCLMSGCGCVEYHPVDMHPTKKSEKRTKTKKRAKGYSSYYETGKGEGAYHAHDGKKLHLKSKKHKRGS